MAEYAYPPIRPGYIWEVSVKIVTTPPMFPTGVQLASHVRRSKNEEILVTLTTENGGITRVDDDTISFVITGEQSTNWDNLSSVQWDIVRTDVAPDRHLGVRIKSSVKQPFTRDL